MKKLKLYIVTKSSTDDTFRVGDIIWLSNNMDLNNATARGWLPRDEWDTQNTNNFKYDVCISHRLSIINGSEYVERR